MTPGAAGRKGPWLLVVGLVVLLVAVGAWTGVAGLQRERTSVTWAGQLRCSGSRVTHEHMSTTGEPVLAMRLQQSMLCTLPVRIENHGWVPVEVERVRLPFLGPMGGAAVRVAELEGRPPEQSLDDAVDAVFTTHRRLAPGSADEFVIEFSFRPEGCTDRGIMWVAGMPQVTLDALGWSGPRASPDLIGFRGTRESSCSP